MIKVIVSFVQTQENLALEIRIFFSPHLPRVVSHFFFLPSYSLLFYFSFFFSIIILLQLHAFPRVYQALNKFASFFKPLYRRKEYYVFH
jgi:hypothetical protein